jgi:hypothetical protein
MTIWAMILLSGVLILILTGTLGTIFVFLGWIVVAVLAVAILRRLTAFTFRPFVRPFRYYSERWGIRDRIEKRQQLGNDASSLEKELAEMKQRLPASEVKTLQKHITEKQHLGYDTSDLERELAMRLGRKYDD